MRDGRATIPGSQPAELVSQQPRHLYGGQYRRDGTILPPFAGVCAENLICIIGGGSRLNLAGHDRADLLGSKICIAIRFGAVNAAKTMGRPSRPHFSSLAEND